MSIFQIFAILFALFMFYWVRNSQKRRELSTVESSLWYSVWFIFIILALFPNLLLGIVFVLNFARVFDLLVVLSFMIIIVLLFNIYLKNKKLEKKLEILVRRISLNKN